MTDDRFYIELGLPEIVEFRIEESFDLTQRLIAFAKASEDIATTNLMREVLDHINGLYQTQNMMMKEYNSMLSEWNSLLEATNGNNRADPK